MRKVGIQGQSSTLVCLLALVTPLKAAGDTAHQNRSQEHRDPCGHVHAYITKGEDALQGTYNELVSFYST